MSRTCATALALVNWKGVFYERYLLDRHVTALEGANGAGKTTVMIAAYVVLLPDLVRLRFTNLGETAATGGDRGLYGRLGEPGRPSYAALELRLVDGSVAIAGVELVRKSEPTLELTPFLVSGLDLGGRLKEIFLRSSSELDAIPDLAQIRQAVTERGGKLQTFGSVKEYFAALFELGVTPLRLATEEERTKLHDMLRTSMTGGISRALTTELRSFLLKEESGLADTLARMRTNLDACRRTRAEVVEARALEQEISSVFAAGQAMFAARYAAARTALADRTRERDAASARAEAAAAGARELLDQAAAAKRALEETTARLAETRARATTLEGRRTAVASARAVAATVAAAEAEVAAAEARVDETSAALASAVAAQAAALPARDLARNAYEAAARGLGDLQAGLEELHRRAHERRRAEDLLAEARARLARPELAPEDTDATLADVRARLAEVDARRAHAARDAALADVQRTERAEALAALARLRPGHGVPDEEAFGLARSVLAELAALDPLADRRAELASELAAAEARRTAARELRARAGDAGIELPDDAGPEVLARLHAAADRALRDAEAEVRAGTAAAEAAERGLAEAERTVAKLEAAQARHEALAPLVARVLAGLAGLAAAEPASASPPALSGADDVLAAREALAAARERARALAARLDRDRRGWRVEADELELSAGFAPDLLAVQGALGAELLASRFEDASPDEAPWLEAALGPLASALVVPDVARAAEALSTLTEAPEAIWLVGEDEVAAALLVATKARSGPEAVDVVIREAIGVRVARPPRRPMLGRAARQARAASLRAEADALGAPLAAALEAARELEGLVHDTDRLLVEVAVLIDGDPAVRLATARAEAKTLADTLVTERVRIASGEKEVLAAAERRTELEELLADAHHLAAPPTTELAARLAEAERAIRVRDAAAADRAILAARLDALRLPPALADAAASAAAAEERDRLFAAVTALEELGRRRHALAYPAEPESAGPDGALREALEAQHVRSREALDRADEALREAERDVARRAADADAATRARDTLATTLAARRADLATRAGAELDDLGALDAELTEIGALAPRLADEERERAAALAVLEERSARAAELAASAATAANVADAELTPIAAAFRGFHELAEAARVVPDGPAPDGTAADLVAAARAQRDLLLGRLDAVRSGEAGASAVRAAFAREGDDELAYLDAWLAARSWTMRRLPAAIAEVADPTQAIGRLRADLADLAERVTRQETSLRGGSEDVARGIDLQLRKTAARVRRLNRDLEQVSFGSVGAVRVTVRRVERMDQVLRALRTGGVQELLFQSNLPLEEALGEIFRRYGGGGKSGAAKILDYREYAELVVEIQRRGATDWELASPTRLSTGEAIGVGAALMMVILTEWERDANLLRSDRATGTLRFLFLDEANRLSPDNLVVLFDLCRMLDLQLLVAAPEVAHAHGNTTYRLVRHVDAAGREEVLVSGRRAIPADPTPPGTIAEPTNADAAEPAEPEPTNADAADAAPTAPADAPATEPADAEARPPETPRGDGAADAVPVASPEITTPEGA